MTLGTDRVRLDFNPSNNDAVHQIKSKAAELIDLCDSLKGHAVTTGSVVLSEKNRLPGDRDDRL